MTSDIPLIKRLISHGYDINAVESDRETTVYYVARSLGQGLYDVRVLKTLCDEGADVNFVPEGAALHTSILHDLILGHIADPSSLPARMDALKLLLKYGASLRLALHSVGKSPGCIPFIKVLLDAGADIEELWNGMTPLTWAALHKNVKVVQALLDAGANVNGAGHPALFAAIQPRKDHHVYAPTTVATMKALCDAGADMKTLNHHNHSLLSYALTMSGNDTKRFRTWDTVPAVLKALCRAGCDVNFHHHGILFSDAEEEGNTPLHMASSARTRVGCGDPSKVRAECLEILISYGADVNSQNDQGQTPLHSAVSQSELACAQVLLKHGSRMDVKDVDGRTPLMLAQSMSDETTNSEMVALLMEKEA